MAMCGNAVGVGTLNCFEMAGFGGHGEGGEFRNRTKFFKRKIAGNTAGAEVVVEGGEMNLNSDGSYEFGVGDECLNGHLFEKAKGEYDDTRWEMFKGNVEFGKGWKEVREGGGKGSEVWGEIYVGVGEGTVGDMRERKKKKSEKEEAESGGEGGEEESEWAVAAAVSPVEEPPVGAPGALPKEAELSVAPPPEPRANLTEGQMVDAVVKPAPTNLPPEWVVVWSRSNKRWYFFDQKRNKSVWEFSKVS